MTQSLDLDEELLFHIAKGDSWIIIQGEHFDAELIEDDFVAGVYQWQKQHHRDHGRIATPTVLTNQFQLELQEPETSIGDLLDRLRIRYMKNGGREILRAVVQEARDGDPLIVPQLLIRRGRELNNRLAKQGDVFGTGDFERAMYRYDLKVNQEGASFGYEELDRQFYHMRGLNFLIAAPKTMKSWQMVMSAISNTEQGRCPWLYSLELPAEEADMRFRCLCAGVPWWRYVRNAITIDDRKALREVSEAIDGLGMYKIRKPVRGHRGISEMVNDARDAGAEVVLIDQLQYVENSKGHSLGEKNETGEYFGVLNEARDLSDEGPIYIAHQFNRGHYHSEGMPDITLAKGSSAIEEVCTLALGMWANKDMRRSSIVNIGALIARNADPFGEWEMSFDLNRDCRFDIVRRIEDE